jgi:hypothetical protein
MEKNRRGGRVIKQNENDLLEITELYIYIKLKQQNVHGQKE